MNEVEVPLSPRYWRLLQITTLLFFAPLFLGAVIAGALLAGWPGAAAGATLILVTVALQLELSHRRYRAWAYVERDDDLLVRRGVMIRRLTVVPYGRMQFIDVTVGPLERSLGLATVQLHTAAAASDARIPGLDAAEAARLRDQLATLGEARAAGL